MLDILYLSDEEVQIQTNQRQLRIAVIADTHIPDRVDRLHPQLLPAMQEQKIDLILHCGDVISQDVTDTLKEIAPVLTVMGNRDAFFTGANHPFKLLINVFSTSIGMFHGFLSMQHYFTDKLQYILQGYHFEKYMQIGHSLFPTADILCYGHTHTAEIRRYRKQLIINPGTAGPLPMTGSSSWSVLDVYDNGKMSAFFLPLCGFKYKQHQWMPMMES
ncbi:MAG: metallophosphoesterase family protein [Anaerolineaceae bacterium]|nr:metallophosphoesterase family protein [Anaerolineaceae bacterium]